MAPATSYAMPSLAMHARTAKNKEHDNSRCSKGTCVMSLTAQMVSNSGESSRNRREQTLDMRISNEHGKSGGGREAVYYKVAIRLRS